MVQIYDTYFGGFIKFDTKHHRNLWVISGSSGASTLPRSWCRGPSGRLVEVGRKRPGHQSPLVQCFGGWTFVSHRKSQPFGCEIKGTEEGLDPLEFHPKELVLPIRDGCVTCWGSAEVFCSCRWTPTSLAARLRIGRIPSLWWRGAPSQWSLWFWCGRWP